MNTRSIDTITSAVVIFAGMALAFAVLIIAARSLADPFDQSVLTTTGSVLLGSGLTFFLVRVFQLKARE